MAGRARCQECVRRLRFILWIAMDVPMMTPIPGRNLTLVGTTLTKVGYQTIATIAAGLFKGIHVGRIDR